MAENTIATTTDAAAGPRMDSLKSLAQTPAARQFLLLVGIAAAVAIGVAVVLWSRTPNYGLLYGNLTQKDAAAIAQVLQAGGTPYKLSPDGGSIMVPSASIPTLRLKLASQGLPQGSARSSATGSGDSPFGMSDMAERSHYQQMLENDLASTIDSLDSIRGARVHLAMPKPSAFIRANSPASASVVVTLYPGRQLGSSQVAAIVHLVAASVPGLDPRHVSVIDQQGQLLTTDDPDSPAAVGDTQLRLTSRIEDNYASRIEQLLAPLVGANHVRAQVFADVDFSRTEKASETYGPNQGLLRSEQTSSSERMAGDAQKGAVPGALSNQPPATVSQPTAANPAGGPGNVKAGQTANANGSNGTQPQQVSNQATRNFELDKTIAHVTAPAGRISRLSVAVVVDNKQVPDKDGKLVSTPFSATELKRMTDLVKNAVGFDAQRGDTVSVINEAFRAKPQEAPAPSIPFWQKPGVSDLIKEGIGILLVLALVFGLLRPIMRGLLKPAQPQLPQTVVRQEDEEATEIDKPQKLAPAIAYEQQLGLAKRMATENPKQVAQVVKNWVATDAS